jgi:hypothetical protein
MERPCCDECGLAVAAKDVVSLPSGRALYFCRHHAEKYRPKLEAMGALIYPLRNDDHTDAHCSDLVQRRGFCSDIECTCACHLIAEES